MKLDETLEKDLVTTEQKKPSENMGGVSETTEQQKPFENMGDISETADEQKFDQYRYKTLDDIESKASEIKKAGSNKLDNASRSYKFPEEYIASIRQESQVDANLQSVSTEIDQLTENTSEQISQVSKIKKIEQTPEEEVQKKNIEKERTFESFQEKRGRILTNLLTSETINSGLNLVPFAGGGKMLIESISGKELSGHKLTGKERIIHGAIGAGSLALDFTGIGEVGKGGIIAGRSIALVEKIGAGLARKGAIKSARIFEKTGEFMARNPELTAKAEAYADKRIKRYTKKGTIAQNKKAALDQPV